jgi:outer membrane protein TolC
MQRKRRKAKIKVVWLFSVIWLGLVSLTSAGELDQLVNQALQANPDLKSAEARYKSYLARVPQAGALPDPNFMFGYSNVPRSTLALDVMEMSGIELGLSQEIPLFKLGLMKKSQWQMAESEKESYTALKNHLVSQVKQNYYDLWYWQKALEVTLENKTLLEDLSKVASVKYSVGEGLQQDVLQAQLEITDLLHEILMLEEQNKASRAKLNVLLNRPPQESLKVAEEPRFVDLKQGETELQSLALQSSPALTQEKAMTGASQAEYSLAKREYWPDLEIGASYMIRSNRLQDELKGEDLLSFRVGLNLPLYFWTKQSKKVQETKWAWESSRSRLEGMTNQVKLEVSESYYQLQSLKEQLRLHNDVLGLQARQNYESARSAYQVNRINFATLLKAQEALYKYEIDFNRLLAGYLKAKAELEEIIGKALEN